MHTKLSIESHTRISNEVVARYSVNESHRNEVMVHNTLSLSILMEVTTIIMKFHNCILRNMIHHTQLKSQFKKHCIG